MPSTSTTDAPSTTTTAPQSSTTTTVPALPDGEITRITDGDALAFRASISADGRYVAYESKASNLVPGDTNGFWDVFVWDRDTDTTIRLTDGNGSSRSAAISGDGRYVTFGSGASDLVPDDTNGVSDVFVWDRDTDTTTRITDGDQASGSPVISADGRTIAFNSTASNLAPEDTDYFDLDVFVWNADTGTTTRITDGWCRCWQIDESSFVGSISDDGRYVTFTSHSSILVPDDTNEREDVFLWDSVTGIITRISDVASQHPIISGDGRFVAYNWALKEVNLWDSATGQTTRITDSYRGSRTGGISADGRYVTVQSYDLMPDDTNDIFDVYVWDRITGTMTRITDGNDDSGGPAISADGDWIVFESDASNLVPDDTNAVGDLFLWERAG